MRQNTLVVAIISGAVCFVIGFGGGASLTMPNREKTKSIKELQDKEQQIQNKLGEAKLTAERATKVAEQTLKLAKKEAETILKEAEKEAEDYALVQKAGMDKLYPNLRKYQLGINVVNEKYLKSFRVVRLSAEEIWGDDKNLCTIKIEIHNDTRNNIKPSIDILFLNKQGFITGSSSSIWLFSSIKPGETRIDEKQCKFRYGEPVYYSVEFD